MAEEMISCEFCRAKVPHKIIFLGSMNHFGANVIVNMFQCFYLFQRMILLIVSLN